nr:GIY-YIG nuclease family protein [Prochlorococcus marinus]
MKKEYKEIFWKLYAIKKDAEKLQEQFMPEKDRALLEKFINGCQWYYLTQVFWPESIIYPDTEVSTDNNAFFGFHVGVSYSVEDINWNNPESYNLKIKSHIKVLMRVMKIIDFLRHTKANTIEDTSTPLKKLFLDFCDLWEKYIVFFWNYLGFSISIGRLSNFIEEYEALSRRLGEKKISEDKRNTWLEYQKKYFEARFKIKEFLILHTELSFELSDKEQEEENIKYLMKDNDENFEETKNDFDEIDDSDVGFVYFIRNKDLYKIGKTNNMLRRMKQLEPDELLDSVRCSNYHQLEREVQAQFKAVRIPQTEYYRLNNEQIKKVYELLRKDAK